jgi:hypothetical protein
LFAVEVEVECGHTKLTTALDFEIGEAIKAYA